MHDEARPGRRITGAQWRLVGLIVALAVGRVAYDLLVRHRLQETAALFIGLPAILAVAFALTPRARSATGAVLKGMTIALLLSSLLLNEGLICILFAAPLFYLVGIVIGLMVDFFEDRRRGRLPKSTYGLLLVPFLSMSIEGATEALSFGRVETVSAERIVAARPADVEAALSRTPRFDAVLPLMLRLGFPTPVGGEGAGLRPGDTRTIHFTAGGTSASVTFEIAERSPETIRFRAVADRTPVARWLDWEEAEVRWTRADDESTRVRWSLRYRRRLDPAWYFAPLERTVVGGAAGYLIDALATPRQQEP